jgi:tripartite-type tricarboxylate transporter receptor subunit TctC
VFFLTKLSVKISTCMKTLLKLLTVFALTVSTVWATEYKLILNNPIGSGADQVARRISQLAKEQSNIILVVHNIGAGGGVVAAQQFKQERMAVIFPNTSMLIYGPLSGNNELTKAYSIKDFNIIADLGLSSSVWYTHTGSGIETAEDLVRVLPTLPKSAIGVGSQDSMANAKALVNLKKLDVPVVSYKNHNDTAIAVAGRHTTVGVGIMGTDSIYALAQKGDLRILGYSGMVPFTYKGFALAPISRQLRLPAFYGGSWVAITPGDTDEHRTLRTALLKTLQDPELQALIKETWPLGGAVPFINVLNTATQHQDLLK